MFTVIVFSLISIVYAFPSYRTRLPNDGASAIANSGLTCRALGHENCIGGTARVKFGLDFARLGYTWNQEFCNLDSDGDGLTNGQELGDPCCKWTPTNGASLRTTMLSHPGDSSSTNSAPAVTCNTNVSPSKSPGVTELSKPTTSSLSTRMPNTSPSSSVTPSITITTTSTATATSTATSTSTATTTATTTSTATATATATSTATATATATSTSTATTTATTTSTGTATATPSPSILPSIIANKPEFCRDTFTPALHLKCGVLINKKVVYNTSDDTYVQMRLTVRLRQTRFKYKVNVMGNVTRIQNYSITFDTMNLSKLYNSTIAMTAPKRDKIIIGTSANSILNMKVPADGSTACCGRNKLFVFLKFNHCFNNVNGECENKTFQKMFLTKITCRSLECSSGVTQRPMSDSNACPNPNCQNT